jgi:hypothetical protein
MKITTQAVTHTITVPVTGRPSDWSVQKIEGSVRQKITKCYGEKARIISLHVDHYMIKATVEVDEIHIDYASDGQGEEQ